MHEDFESYKKELDRVRLTEEGKRALAESLSRCEPEERPVIRSRRLTAGAGRIAAIAAVVCLLVSGAVAAVVGSPTLRDNVFGDSAGYSQSSGFVGRSVEKNGWTVTITDCVGDDRNLCLGIEVEAPEGVVLDGTEDYRFLDYSNGFIRNGGSSGMDQLPDDDPADNKIRFMLRYYSSGFDSDGFNGGSRFALKKLIHDFRWEEQEDGNCVQKYVEDCGATWDFGYLEISYADSTIRLEPDLPVTTLDVEATITSVEVSPLGAVIRIEGDALLYHHDWVPKNAPDGWYGCMEYQEVYLYTEDGEVIPANYQDGASAGGGCSGGTVEEDAFIVLDRRFDELVDVDSLTAISVCGVTIPLK
jgi:hypothetical protein